MRRLLPAIGFVAALAGCAEIQYENVQSPIVLNPHSSSLKSYTGIKESDLEKRLVELARTADYEESWYYNKKTGELVETGIDESSIGATQIFRTAILLSDSDIAFYHIHPFKGYFEIINIFEGAKPSPTPLKQFQAAIGKPMTLGCPPGISDVMGYVDIITMDDLKASVEFKVADPWGISTITFDKGKLPGSSEIQLFANSINALINAYYSGTIDSATLLSRFESLGIKLNYNVVDPSTVPVEVTETHNPIQPYALKDKVAGTPPVDK